MIGTSIFIIGFSIYFFRLSKIENCLFRTNFENKKKFCYGSIIEGIIGPIRTLYYSTKYNGIKSGLNVFKNLFISFDNPFFIISILFIFSGIFI